MLKIDDTPRLRFLPPDPEDEEDLQKLSALPPLPGKIDDMTREERHASFSKLLDMLEDSLQFMQDYISLKEVDGWKKCVFHCRTPSGELVGRIAVNYINTPRPSIDVAVLSALRRQGYAEEMVRAVCSAVFSQTDADHIEYDYLKWNHASRRVIEKLGGVKIYEDERGESYSITKENFHETESCQEAE